MNRRDIIITAVLINAGLLIVLFVCSLKPTQAKEVMLQPQIVQKAPEAVHLKESALPAPKRDVVEHAMVTAVKKEVPAPVVAAKPAVQPQAPAVEPKITPQLLPKPTQPVAAKPIPAMLSSSLTVEVQPGDALEKIAKHYGVAVDDLMKANHLVDTRLKIGQKLIVPISDKPVPPVQKEVNQDRYEYYVVKNGDNPWTIAVKNHIKVDDLLRLNDLDESKARRLKPGDKLRIK